MAEDFNDFFTEHAQWVDASSDQNPPMPPDTSARSGIEHGTHSGVAHSSLCHVSHDVSRANEPIHASSMMKRTRRTLRKKRAWRRSLLTVLCVVVVALLGFGGVRLYFAIKAWQHAQNENIIDDWPGPGEGSVSFTVENGEGVLKIGAKLVKAHIVKSQSTFVNIVAANNKILYPGVYQLKKHMQSIDVVNILSDQSKAGGFLEVRAGSRINDVIAQARKIGNISQTEFQQVFDTRGEGILPPEAQGNFEGWLEPGVYNVQSLKSAHNILDAMVKKRIAKLDALGVPKGQMRMRIITIASIAEAEVNNHEYYGKVARVIENRLAKNMPLGMDSTVAYGANVAPNKLTQAMLDDATNPYNTRIRKGLPPSAIGSASAETIQAVMNPPAGNWLYFVTTNLTTGETKFTDHESEFWQFVKEYKQSNKNAN